MSRLNELLNECGVFFLATEKGQQAKLRPIGGHMERDGKEIFCIGDYKDAYRQLVENPYCEIAGMVNKAQWLRLTGKAVFETDDRYEKEYYELNPAMKKIYNEETGRRLATFHLEEAEAKLYSMGSVVEDIPV